MTPDDIDAMRLEYFPSARNIGRGTLTIVARKLSHASAEQVRGALERLRESDLAKRDVDWQTLCRMIPRPVTHSASKRGDSADWLRVGAHRTALGREMLASETCPAGGENQCGQWDWIGWYDCLNRAGQYIAQYVPHDWPETPGVFQLGPDQQTDWGAHGTLSPDQVEDLARDVESARQRERIRADAEIRRRTRRERIAAIQRRADNLRTFGPTSEAVKRWLSDGMRAESLACDRIADTALF